MKPPMLRIYQRALFLQENKTTFKASKKSKKVVQESSNEKDDDSDDESTVYDPDEMALFIRRFSKMMSKQKFFKGDKKDKFGTKTKRTCYNCVVTILLIVLMSIGMKRMTRRGRGIRRRRRATRKTSITRRKGMVRLTLARSGTQMMRVPILIVMVWPPWQSRAPLLQVNLSSPTSIREEYLPHGKGE
jgi:hypothetical protein